jgi:DNA-binding XRE family transcriptional regulator
MAEMTLKELGQLMQNARESRKDNGKKISREAIGNAIGVSGQTVYLWESGNQQPGILNIMKFCEYLGLTIDDLLGVKKNACLPC